MLKSQVPPASSSACSRTLYGGGEFMISGSAEILCIVGNKTWES